MTPHESEAATPHERVAPAARGDTREPVARPRVAESPLPAPEIRAHARPSTAAGVQRRAAPQLPEHHETRAHAQPSTAAGPQRRATAQPREPIAPEARSDTREPITRARAVESPPPALEAKPHAEPATAAKVRRQATAQPRERSAPATTAEPPEAVTRTRAVESPPPAPEAQPHAQATTAAQIRRRRRRSRANWLRPRQAAEPPEAVTRARAVESPPPAQSTRPPAQASPGADVDRQATEQRHEHAAPEASTEAREPVVPSTVADAPVPTSEARTHSDADSTSEASKPWRAPARPTATGADVRRRAKTPPVQPHRQDAVDVPAYTRESTVQVRSGDATAAELTVSSELEPLAPTRPAPAAEDRDEPPDATQREAPVAARRPGFDLHALLSASSFSRSSAAPAGSIQRVAQAHGAELTEGAARLPGLGVQRTRSAQRSEAAIAFPRTIAEQTPRAGLQLVPSLTPVAQAAPAAHLPAPAPVALPAPPDPPATVQRIKSVADPESTARERFSEASDDEFEVLADRLYDHIRTRFRSELLIDRERAGLLADRY